MKLSLAILVAIASSVSATVVNDKRDAFSDQALSVHNSYRAKYGAPALRYDNNLAAGAASYAARCHFAHSGGNYGENLYATNGSGATIKNAVDSWMSEVAEYDYSNPRFSEATGHFTQVVWKASTNLGCDSHHCTTGSPFGSGDWTYIICRYTPPGNVQGQFAANVGRPR
ncbi:hypothetical protein AGABI1DRAFT_127209 [Agaricus bisporus var. burnettii JB137-S8]|uniref:SCP domain-containing protein n=2 Tax=Agaricus bisporus var. burnettii TaxID=192524 RepID=K5XCZ0_AGABU|nr:uncharacterized protein AGABI1DRAFT_127209 [Agaricus bisporus var. burnettii JB137-S8]EKM81188.1 hypothetical protein AGABI1DRAFT_127209 [Agaricus bisporus var. burnettii JB137-S8]KAF7782752.1 hypothetical protein Agabi119p4_2128 [Agaricus bisporus var. burnettii]